MIDKPATTDLLDWYDSNARTLPWRVSPKDRALGEVPDPYRVWLSEVMLQQTTVATVKSYFENFIGKWPTVEDLAAATDDDVMRAWAGLGYYSRARNLKKCAETVATIHNGRFPDTEKDLLDLPGIGPYTAAAIAAIAFDRRSVVVDGNVERVMARLFRIEEPLPGSKPAIRERMDALTLPGRPGDFAQAVMDLGATICSPKRPACGICPWMTVCIGRRDGVAEHLPYKQPKKKKPTRYGIAVVYRRQDGAVLLRRRPPTGLLGGMSEIPGSEWQEGAAPAAEHLLAGHKGSFWQAPSPVRHTFTHFHLELTVYAVGVEQNHVPPDGHWWSSGDTVMEEALPTVMKKALAAGLKI